MTLITELQKQEEANSTKQCRMLKGIKVGKYTLSIQGSYGHYCHPRQTLPVADYLEMELAIINEEGSMISINNDNVFKKFSRYDELLTQADSLDTDYTVYGYVPVDLINDLYCFLCIIDA